ncbi:MAG: hypothetical protein RLZZ236_1942 [Bacteroidota bacterium]|jgi:hypothetical protein
MESYWLSSNMLLVYAFVIEFFLRLLPTEKSYSIITLTKKIMLKLHELLEYIVPDRIIKK